MSSPHVYICLDLLSEMSARMHPVGRGDLDAPLKFALHKRMCIKTVTTARRVAAPYDSS